MQRVFSSRQHQLFLVNAWFKDFQPGPRKVQFPHFPSRSSCVGLTPADPPKAKGWECEQLFSLAEEWWVWGFSGHWKHGLNFPGKWPLVCFISLEFGENVLNTLSSSSPWLTLPWNLNTWWEGEKRFIHSKVIAPKALGFRADSPKPFPPRFYVQIVGKDSTDKPHARAVALGPEYPEAYIRICSHLTMLLK